MTTMMTRPCVTSPVWLGLTALFAGLPVEDVRTDLRTDQAPVLTLTMTVPLSEQDMTAILYTVLDGDEIPEITPEETRRLVTDNVINVGCQQVAEYIWEAVQPLRDGAGNPQHWNDCLALVRAAYTGVTR